MVCRRGETVAEKIGAKSFSGTDPMRRDTLFRIASLTKPITAVAAMILVGECRLRLDDPIDPLVPELANRRVLKRPDGPIDGTVPAHRPLTLRDLLTLRMGLGYIMAPSDDYPIQHALNEQQILHGPPRPQALPAPDEWIHRVASLPLMYQPGERWMYDLGLDVAGVVIARASGQTFESFLRERVFEPLGMIDTGLSVPDDQIDRLATSYETDDTTGESRVFDEARGGQWSRRPAFASGSGGLVSTVNDYLALGQMLVNQSRHGRERILSRPTIELMTTDQVTSDQKAGMEIFLGESRGWGLGMSVVAGRDSIFAVPGRFGWDGGLSTSAYMDPKEDLAGILMTQQAWTSPAGPAIYHDFWTSVYASIDD